MEGERREERGEEGGGGVLYDSGATDKGHIGTSHFVHYREVVLSSPYILTLT